jgi:chemotaxis protein histidine kinase CheA
VRIDKGMVDVLVEPLMHLVRNAVDHGLEPAAERVAAGKPAQGCLRVTARQQSNTLLLEIADDGRGLDSARLRDRALALGLLDAAAAAAQGERELQQLIFLPGFSTAPRVSGVSGRGVGMDAVKASVTRMGGQIELASTPGQGTVFTLHLPLSAAIQNVVLVAAGTRQFAVPERNVAEVVSLPAAALQTVQGQACCLLRGVTLPLYRLAELLGDAGGSDASSRLEVVVITDGVHRIGLVVGQVLGRPEVYLRELHPDLARLPGVGGASILGDGRVVIIVDCEKLFALALRRAQSLRSLVRLS